MRCTECGFEVDEANESQIVCPRCGADPNPQPGRELVPELLVTTAPVNQYVN